MIDENGKVILIYAGWAQRFATPGAAVERLSELVRMCFD